MAGSFHPEEDTSLLHTLVRAKQRGSSDQLQQPLRSPHWVTHCTPICTGRTPGLCTMHDLSLTDCPAGPRAELAALPAFVELAMLMPEHHVHLHFIGPDVPEELHCRTCKVVLSDAENSQRQHSQGESVSSACFGQAPG